MIVRGMAKALLQDCFCHTLTLRSEYPSATTGTNTMAEPVTIDRPSVAKPVSRRRSRKPATVSASALALHLDCSRTYISNLEAEGVIQRQPSPCIRK